MFTSSLGKWVFGSCGSCLPALEREGRRPGLSLGYPAWGVFQKPRAVPAAGADAALLSYREGSPERASAL